MKLYEKKKEDRKGTVKSFLALITIFLKSYKNDTIDDETGPPEPTGGKLRTRIDPSPSLQPSISIL